MMESARHRTRALPAGVVASTLLHLLTASYLLFWITRPPPLEDRPYDLSHAIPVTMEMLPPPKEKPKPTKTPIPIPVPEVLETAAPQQAVEVPAEPIKPPDQPVEQPQEPAPPPQAVSYAQYVRGVIEREKRYPREALMSGDQGVAVVYFVINRFGTVLAFRLDKRTGSASLDAEVKRLMRRIQQFPAVPDYEYPGKDRIEFTLPVEFKLTT